MKIAIITDLHFGARSDSHVFAEHFERFYTNVFFPKLKAEGIDTCLILGDTFDRRKYTNHESLQRAHKMLFVPLWEGRIDTHVIVGNHDVAFRNTNEINSPSLLLSKYDNLTIYAEAKDLQLKDGSLIAMVPWINSQNSTDTLKYMAGTKAPVCCGHFEISGFAMYAGLPPSKGMDRSVFNKFDLVFSGHYHHRSSNGHIHYLGNPYEITWNDYNDARGFHIFDTDSRQLEFIQNPYSMFHKLVYDDKNNSIDQVTPELTGKSIKLIVLSKADHYKFDKYLNSISALAPAELKVVENFSEFKDAEADDEVDLEDIPTFINSFVDSSEAEGKEELKQFMNTLYVESLNVQVA